ncbi:Telomere maintenance protein [Mycena kentingensis (nom. inval.)]|nr:Telomere maintenance protein [Mycena kentingensis (nom. inval.)]
MLETTSTTPTNDDIEKVIELATASALADGRTIPLRDTRTQLFVANLPYRVRWQDLKDLFRRAGTVLRADVSLGPDNRSRGYGTVLLATAEDAGRAIDMFTGYSWQGRILEVRADRVRDFDQPFPEVEEEYAPMGRNLFVGNLPFHVQWQDLKDLFRQAGTIVRADVALGPEGRSRGFGTVVFATEKDARRAVSMFSGYEFNGRTLKVHYDKFSPSPTPFDLGLPPSAAFDLGLGADYTADVFGVPHPLLHPRPFDSQHSLVQQLQQLQLEHQNGMPDAPSASSSSTGSARSSPPNTATAVAPTPPSSAKRSPSSPHPHHPGPIALPPLPAIPADSSGAYPAPNGINPAAAAAAAFNPPPYGLTPVGLPPITPSMPPFSFHGMPIPSPGVPTAPQPASYFGMPVGPPTPTSYGPGGFLNVTPLATPTSPHFPAYIMNTGMPSPGIAMPMLVGPPSVGILSPGAFWGRAGDGAPAGVFGAPGQGPVGQAAPGGVHPAFAHHFGGSPGVFGMHSVPGPPEEPKGYFDLAAPPMQSAIEKEILRTPDGKRTELAEKEDSSAVVDAETQSAVDADERTDGGEISPPLEAFKGRRYSSHDQPPTPLRDGPSGNAGGRRAPPPPIQLPVSGSR